MVGTLLYYNLWVLFLNFPRSLIIFAFINIFFQQIEITMNLMANANTAYRFCRASIKTVPIAQHIVFTDQKVPKVVKRLKNGEALMDYILRSQLVTSNLKHTFCLRRGTKMFDNTVAII